MPLKFNQDQKYCVLPCLKDQKKEKRKKRLRDTYFLLFFNFFPDVVNDNCSGVPGPKFPVTPCFSSSCLSLSGIMPPPTTRMSSAPFSLRILATFGNKVK